MEDTYTHTHVCMHTEAGLLTSQGSGMLRVPGKKIPQERSWKTRLKRTKTHSNHPADVTPHAKRASPGHPCVCTYVNHSIEPTEPTEHVEMHTPKDLVHLPWPVPECQTEGEGVASTEGYARTVALQGKVETTATIIYVHTYVHM